MLVQVESFRSQVSSRIQVESNSSPCHEDLSTTDLTTTDLFSAPFEQNFRWVKGWRFCARSRKYI